MSRPCLTLAIAALASWSAACVHAQVPADEAEQRAAIRAEREAAEALYREREAVCAKKFIVSSCVEAARLERHDTIKQLDLRQAALDDAQREARAAQRRAEIASKQAGEEARKREAQARERSADAQRGGVVKQPAPPAAKPATPARAGKAQPSPQERAAEEARARHAYALKQLEAEARRQEAARRNAEHARKTKQAAPLPVPGEVPASGAAATKALGAAPGRPASAASTP
jgi:hypothetical protein